MNRKFSKVLALMEAKGGRISVTDPELKALLGNTLYRLPQYMYDIRKLAGHPVRVIRQEHSHAAIAYELVKMEPATNSTISPAPLSTETAVNVS